MLPNYNSDSKQTLSPQSTNRSDPKSIPDHDSVFGRGDFTGGTVNVYEHVPSKKSSKTRVFSDKPTFSEESAEWNKADYEYNINFLYNHMVKQKQYLKHDDVKYARNRELLATIKTNRQKDYDDTIWKKSEINRLKRETEGYEWQIRHQSALGETSTIRFSAEEKLNRDLVKQQKKLGRQKEFQLKKQIEERISPEVINKYDSAKRLLENEQDKRKRLQQKSQWYDTELASIKEAFEKHANTEAKGGIHLPDINQGKVNIEQDKGCYQNKMSYEITKSTLPCINKGRNNLVNLMSVEECLRQSDEKMDPFTDIQNGYLPQPPSVKKKGDHKRFQRKMRNEIK